MSTDLRTLRLTLVVSGALALGAYEAGVVAQLAYTLGQYQKDLKEGEPPFAVVDIISGASAGAITGAMLATHIMRGGDPAEFVTGSRRVWCSPETNLQNLVALDAKDRNSILSSRKIRAMARRNFHPRSMDASRVRQDEVIFTATLTALDKIPFETWTINSQARWAAWHGASHQDYVTFSADRENVWEVPLQRTRLDSDARLSSWDRMLSFSLASAAFPAVWEPLALKRHSSFFRAPWREMEREIELEYADGGILNNLPLNLAASSRRSLLSRHRREERIYLVIEPDPIKVGPDLPVHDNGNDNVWKVLGKVFGAMSEQSFYEDLRTAQETNHRLEARNQLFHRLAHSFTKSLRESDLPEELTWLDQQLETLLLSLASRSTSEDVVAHYEEQFQSGEHTLHWMGALCESRRQIFLRVVALLDRIANMDDQHFVRVERVRPPHQGLLLGASLGHLGGLVHEGLRLHDFIAGMEHCHHFLQQLAQRRGWPPPTPAPMDLSPEEVHSLENLPSPVQVKERFLAVMSQRLTHFLADEMTTNPLARGAMKLTAPWVLQALARRTPPPK